VVWKIAPTRVVRPVQSSSADQCALKQTDIDRWGSIGVILPEVDLHQPLPQKSQ
jgi:hypothetical protein